MQNGVISRQFSWRPHLVVVAFALISSAANATAGDESESTGPLTSAADVYAMPPLSEPRPVRFEATVLFSVPNWGMMFVTDGKTGIYVEPKSTVPPLKLGARVLLYGSTVSSNPGVIGQATITALTGQVSPSPKQVKLAEIDMEKMGSTFVEIEGTVRSVIYEQPWLHLFVEDDGATAEVHLRKNAELSASDLRYGSRIRVTGVLGSVSDAIPEPIIYVHEFDQLTTLSHSPPATPLHFDPTSGEPLPEPGEVVAVTGISVNRMQPEILYAEGGPVNFKVLCHGARLIGEAREVAIVGEVVAAGPGMVIRAREVSLNRFRSLSSPPVREKSLGSDAYRRITLTGTPSDLLIDHATSSLILNSDHERVLVTIHANREAMEKLHLGGPHRVSATGVLDWKERNGERLPHLLVHSLSDIQLIPSASNQISIAPVYVVTGLGILAGIGLMIWTWTRTLRAKVDARTRELSVATARLRDSYDASRDAIIIADSSGRTIEFNSKVATLLAFDAREGDEISEILNNLFERSKDPRAAKQRWLERENGDTFFELHLAEPDEKVIEVHAAAVRSADQTTAGQQLTFHDITKRKQLEDSLVQAQKMEAVGRLAGGIAHDFNNLLTGIVGSLEVAKLNRDRPLKDSEEFLDSAESAARRAAELIKQLLGYSRKSSLDKRAGDVNKVILDLVGLLRHSLDSSIDLNLELEKKPWMAPIDHVHLEQVIMNLCVNARDALPEKGGMIRISTTNVTRVEGDFVRVSVSDNGKGIPESVQKRIFEPFFTTKDQGEGTGLGLAMSFGIIQQHHGIMECKSKEGKGTTFHIYLPKAKPDEKPAARDSQPQPTISTRHSKSAHILIADDEAVVRAVGEGMLRHEGYKVSSVSNGREALEFLAQHHEDVDLVITDLTMPQMTGKELLIEVHNRHKGIPVMICSGYLVDLNSFAEEAGTRPEGFVAKPFEMGALLGEVSRCLASEDAMAQS